MPDESSNPVPARKTRRWSIFAAAFLLLALALVVIYTSRPAFSSPLAVVVVAAIGSAALLMQLRLRRSTGAGIRGRILLNGLGLIFAIAAVFADRLHLTINLLHVAALGAIVCFALSGIVVLRAFRKQQKN